MTDILRVGMLTPSSNTVLEPVTSALVSAIDGVSVHFSRFRVTQISLDAQGLNQFKQTPMIEAAQLLADARVDSMTWNGTSASWLGLETDRALAAAIERETGVTATTCVLALTDALVALGVRNIGLVTPYTSDVQQEIVDNFCRLDLTCAAETHFGISDNFLFGQVAPSRVAEAIAKVARAEPDAIVILCTNLAAAHVAAVAERELGIPVLDSVVLSLWGALKIGGHDVQPFERWSPSLARL